MNQCSVDLSRGAVSLPYDQTSDTPDRAVVGTITRPEGRGVYFGHINLDGSRVYFALNCSGEMVAQVTIPDGVDEEHAIAYLWEALDRACPPNHPEDLCPFDVVAVAQLAHRHYLWAQRVGQQLRHRVFPAPERN